MGERYQTQELSTHTAELFATAVERAAELLRVGEVVALPTETVYGLAANALDAGAVERIYQVKGRPAHNPIIVHVAGLEMARGCAADWPVQADKLARAFWPGPLTLVLKRAPLIPPVVTAGGETVGIRWPSHPFIQAVIRACGFPLAAPSANLSNRVSPTTAAHVRRQLNGKIPLIVDGGPANIGIESTVLDLTVVPGQVLRPGMVHEESLAAVLGQGEVQRGGVKPGALRSPGQLPRHYSPKARLLVMAWRGEEDLRGQLSQAGAQTGRTWVLSHSRVPAGRDFQGISVIPHDAAAFARALYAELHRCDEAGPEWLVVEQPPAGPEWRGIADRLARAAS